MASTQTVTIDEAVAQLDAATRRLNRELDDIEAALQAQAARR